MANPTLDEIPAPVGSKMAVLMPTSRPLESRRGPPELPGLMAASVWVAEGGADLTAEAGDDALGKVEVQTKGVAQRINLREATFCNKQELQHKLNKHCL